MIALRRVRGPYSPVDIRTLLAFNAYSEGWALYAEQLVDELVYHLVVTRLFLPQMLESHSHRGDEAGGRDDLEFAVDPEPDPVGQFIEAPFH